MIKVNVNPPNPHFRIHADPDCTWNRNAGRRGARVVRIDPGNPAQMFARIGVGPSRFLAQKGFNAVWMEFDFPGEGLARAAIRQVEGVLDQRHKPIRAVDIETHCRTQPMVAGGWIWRCLPVASSSTATTTFPRTRWGRITPIWRRAAGSVAAGSAWTMPLPSRDPGAGREGVEVDLGLGAAA